MLEKLDRKEQQRTKFKAKHEKQSIKVKQSAKEIKNLNVKNDKLRMKLCKIYIVKCIFCLLQNIDMFDIFVYSGDIYHVRYI